ncbi:MAG: hypothetical protein R3268_07325 [Acidiferrobacterales bacterium]|nr:hypothetical protein [Acidiferrobacterales bacterium]
MYSKVVYASEFSIPAHHPALPGHFPGNPVVPGAVVLDEVIKAAESSPYGVRIAGVLVAKFLRPLAPGEHCIVELSPQDDGRIRFMCRLRNELVASGQLVVESAV